MAALMKAIKSNSNVLSRASVPAPRLGGGGSSVKLSKCSLKYAYAISDPFSPQCTGVCVPSGQATASHKVTGFLRFDSKIGTAGFAYIFISPSPCSDAPQVFVTGQTYPFSVTAILSAANTTATGVSLLTVGNLPYTTDDLLVRSAEEAQNVAARVASAGISIQYTGTALNQSGMVYMYRDQGHGNVSLQAGSFNNNSITSISQSPTTTVCNFTRDRCMISDFAAVPAEMNFERNGSSTNSSIGYRTSIVYPFAGESGDLSVAGNNVATYQLSSTSGSSYLVGSPTTVIMVTGQAGQDFHCEYVVHVEYIGNKAAASYTPTDSDVQGAGMVLEAANTVTQRKTSSPNKSNWQLMYDGLAFAAKRALPVVIPVAEKAVIAMLA